MKKTKKNNNDTKKILITLAIVASIIVIIGGATFAYWAWETNTAQRTNVNVTVLGGTLSIVGDNVTNTANGTVTGIYPTTDCDGAAALVAGEVTVTAVNQNETNMTVTPRLDIKLSPVSGRTLSDDAKSHLHWAVVDTTSATTKTCDNPDYKGTFHKIGAVTLTKSAAGDVTITGPTVQAVPSNSTITMNITNMNTSYDITNTLTFTATPLATTTKKYKVYVWLDSTYTHTNSGDTVSDPMQGLGISVKWSANSTMIQS